MGKVVCCKNISHSYQNIQVLDDVNIEVVRGELLAVVGRSGAGKSTLLQIAGTLLSPDKGEVYIGDQLINGLDDAAMSNIRATKIGFVFQSHHLLPEFSALENVMFPGLIARRNSTEVASDARRLLEMLGLSDRIAHKPAQLSGGEQQRVAVARALVNSPGVVFADEPTGNLDSVSRSELNELFVKLRDQLGQTFVIVTHESDLSKMCDRVVTISDGRII